MKKATEYSQNNFDSIQNHLDNNKISPSDREKITQNHIRQCPSCSHMTIKEMPGGRDATCKNCGYKDPCCYD